MAGFSPFPLRPGRLLATPGAELHGFRGGQAELGGGTHYVFVTEGVATLHRGLGALPLVAGMYAVLPGAGRLDAGGAVGVVITAPEYAGVFQVGGPLEARGRLAYIDGCTDTLLVCPPRLGEPCLNHLHIPAGTRQSAHTHPSDRLGVIARGSGRCVTVAGSFPLEAGLAWWIPAGTLHCFHTDAEALDVVAWHPDSDFGPTDEDHPMKNRTVLPVAPGATR